MDPQIDWPEGYREFFRLFNARDFFEAHEVLEDVWVMEVPPLRNYYKGLIQSAVALCHWERGNHEPARRLWVLARGYLAPYPAHIEGFDLAGYLKEMDELFGPLLSQPGVAIAAPPVEVLPILRLEEPVA
ncbi:MAG: DUF309 domain-containing protein [Candidatus Sumerlaeia bacterium]|nr:DUF309 domain-containing protein [Candidatus Sumerlaeia bacterium]